MMMQAHIIRELQFVTECYSASLIPPVMCVLYFNFPRTHPPLATTIYKLPFSSSTGRRVNCVARSIYECLHSISITFAP